MRQREEMWQGNLVKKNKTFGHGVEQTEAELRRTAIVSNYKEYEKGTKIAGYCGKERIGNRKVTYEMETRTMETDGRATYRRRTIEGE